MMIGESTGKTLTTRVDYVVDYLGSVTAIANSSANIVVTNRYKPYGTLLSGNALVSGQYAWTGNTGSRHSGVAYAEQYNRARHYSSTNSQWTTRDPLWPDEAAYGYVIGNPITKIDACGTKPLLGPHEAWEKSAQNYINGLLGIINGSGIDMADFYASFKDCTRVTVAIGANRGIDSGDQIADAIKDLLAGKGRVLGAPEPIRIELHTDCPKNWCGNAAYFQNIFGKPKWTGWYITICVERTVAKDGTIKWEPRKGCGPAHCILLHELLHTMSLSHSNDPDNIKDDAFFECLNKVAGCESYTAGTATGGKADCKWGN